MQMSQKSFLVFQVVFWLLAGFVLMLSGLSQMPEWPAIARNIYLAALGFVASFFLSYVYRTYLIERFDDLLWPVLVASYLVGVFCTISVNPITFGQLGFAWEEIGYSALFSGSLNFGLVLALWSTIYLSVQGVPLFKSMGGGDHIASLVVESDGGRRVVALQDVLYVRAAGDYVEIATAEKTHLKRACLGALAEQLDPAHFMRIHRSHLVNLEKVSAVSLLSKGRAEFHMANGDKLVSSQSYRAEIEQHFNLA